MPDLTLSGTRAGQPVSDAAVASPFSAVTLATTATSTPYATATVALSSTANGALSHLGVGTLSADGATYTVSGSPAVVQAALRGLVFTPVAHEVPVGQSVATGFALTVSNAAGAVTDVRTSVVATAADTPPTVTDTSALHAPSVSPPPPSSFTPFAYTTIADPDAGASETTGITLAQNGTATDAVGLLSGAGLTKVGVGSYVLSAGSPAAETSALQALRFTPAHPGTAASLDVNFTVADGFGAPVTGSSTVGLGANPGGDTVVSNSSESPITYIDTPVARTTHTYATTIDAVLSSGVVVYERSFDLPYADEQVQAAVTQARAAVQAAGATPGSPQQTASNAAVLNSQTSTMETGRNNETPVITTGYAFGPTFVGPNTSLPLAESPGVRGFFYVLAGQLDINVDTVSPTTVGRTVTTTSTDLLSQQYVITGTSTAMATTTLVSSSAAGVEGNARSGPPGFADSTLLGPSGAQFTADGTRVLFTSQATNLITADADQTYDLYLKTVASGAIQLVDTTATGVKSNADVLNAAMSADASRVVFSTKATNLIPTATNGFSHLFLKDMASGALTLLDPATYAFTVAGGGPSANVGEFDDLFRPSISGDGRYVAAFADRVNNDIVVFDTLTHTAVDIAAQGSTPVISRSGSTVVFDAGQGGGGANNNQVLAYDTAGGLITVVSTTQAGLKANGPTYDPTTSDDGRSVAFSTNATNLSPLDTDFLTTNVYVKNLATGTLTLVDVTAAGVKADASSSGAVISPDGTKVVFTSRADNLAPGATDGTAHIYVKDLATGVLTLVDGAPGGAPGAGAASGPAISGDNTKVAYSSLAADIAANDVNGAQDVFVSTLSATTTPPPANTAPTIGGTLAGQGDTAGAPINPFYSATVTDPDPNQAETVTVSFTASNGTLSGGGFVQTAPGVYSVTEAAGTAGASAAAAQAALRAATFVPSAGQSATTAFKIVVNDGQATATDSVTSVIATNGPPNTPTAIGGTIAQYGVAGAAISPFPTITVTDPDAGQAETVIVSFNAANGTLSGGGFVQTSPGIYSVTAPAGGAGASAAAAQADLRAATFIPTAGQSTTTNFSIIVNDGQYSATDSVTRVTAIYTTPPAGGGGGGSVTAVPPSMQYGLQTQFQNLSRALAGGNDALTPGTPVYTALQAERGVAAQLDGGQVTLEQAEATLQHLVNGTTAVAVATYGFFTGYTPTAAGLTYLVHSGANATDLNDAYYARFSTENRYINFAVNLATGPGAGAAAFQASYGALSLADATAKAYAAVFGATADAAKVSALLDALVPDGLGGQETRARYFAQYGGDGPNGQGTKAAMIGFLLSNAVHDGSGVYGAATEHYLAALAHGSAPPSGSELALTYGPAVSLVGVAPVPDPAVTG